MNTMRGCPPATWGLPISVVTQCVGVEAQGTRSRNPGSELIQEEPGWAGPAAENDSF